MVMAFNGATGCDAFVTNGKNLLFVSEVIALSHSNLISGGPIMASKFQNDWT